MISPGPTQSKYATHNSITSWPWAGGQLESTNGQGGYDRPKCSERWEEGREGFGCGAAGDRKKKERKMRAQRAEASPELQEPQGKHPSCKQLPGAATTLTSPICSSTCSSGSTVGPWLRLGPRQPKLTGMLRDDEEAPDDGDEGGGGGGEAARNSSESAMRLSWYRRAGPSNRTQANCLSTARAQSPQAPPPPHGVPPIFSFVSALDYKHFSFFQTTNQISSQASPRSCAHLRSRDTGAEHYNSQNAERITLAMLLVRMRARGSLRVSSAH